MGVVHDVQVMLAGNAAQSKTLPAARAHETPLPKGSKYPCRTMTKSIPPAATAGKVAAAMASAVFSLFGLPQVQNRSRNRHYGIPVRKILNVLACYKLFAASALENDVAFFHRTAAKYIRLTNDPFLQTTNIP